MQVESNWVQNALRDWGRRHVGRVGEEIGYARKTNFARLIRDRFNTEDAKDESLPVSSDSMDVDAAVAYLTTRGRQGRIEAAVLTGTYLMKLPRNKVAQRLHLSETEVRNARMMGERAVEMYLVIRCNWEGPVPERMPIVG